MGPLRSIKVRSKMQSVCVVDGGMRPRRSIATAFAIPLGCGHENLCDGSNCIFIRASASTNGSFAFPFIRPRIRIGILLPLRSKCVSDAPPIVGSGLIVVKASRLTLARNCECVFPITKIPISYLSVFSAGDYRIADIA
ncbi:unnamed protein product [Albugo candida]|uniref:Uncharacterized protein n=1 Tax=Albugo candida TaxID=65357 RepID=A0A024GN75_9STRA|nr:unnamed protein product [Albugo candida]|eukprot:CCI47800.1 unnamed protein product [Albugo candida]